MLLLDDVESTLRHLTQTGDQLFPENTSTSTSPTTSTSLWGGETGFGMVELSRTETTNALEGGEGQGQVLKSNSQGNNVVPGHYKIEEMIATQIGCRTR